MEVRENLIKLCEKIGDGHYKITPDCAEYKVFEQWMTDEQIALLMAIKGAMKPNFVGGIARRAGMDKEKARQLLHELTEIGLLVQVLVPKIGLEIYLQPLYTPGVFEFLLLNEPFCRAHPEIAYAFEQHATDSQTEHAMNTPMGAGIMRVIPVENAIPAEAQQIDKERVSYYIEKNADHLCALPCQCRRVRKLMGEGAGDLDESFCLFMGHCADMFINLGRGKKLTKEEAYEMMRHVEEIGCVHQITTLEDGNTFAICNCQPESCLALGVTQYFNTPAFTQSNYVAEIDKEKCVACGQCVDKCANNAIQMGQKLCTKEPIVYKQQELPDDLDWPEERWNPGYRSGRKHVADSGTAPCKTACPAHIAVQGYIKLAAQGKYLDALELIKKENPFPAVCGRICNRRCEDECTRGSIDNAVAIDEVKKFIADKELDRATRFVPKKLHHFDKKIAVIGAGPAGLSCAYFLACDDYKVTVFDKNAQPGGMLRYGIPAFRLEREVLDAEIEVLKELGVEFKCGVEIGKDITLEQLRGEGYEAFYLGIGAQKSAKLGIPGEDTDGVYGGIDFLRMVNEGGKLKLGKKVVVIGGGNVAMDVARTAVRLGADTTVVYRRKEENMPADPAEVAEAKEEGVKFVFEHKPVEIKAVKDKVSELVCDAGTVKCSTVIAAIGQTADWGALDIGELKTNAKGYAEADGVTYQTAQPDIFVGGDIYTGPKFAIDAIAAGKQGAISIHRFVQEGQSLTIGRDRLEYKSLDKNNLDLDEIKADYDSTPRQNPNRIYVAEFKDNRRTFTEEQLKKETARCLGCGASVIDPNKCLGCGVCTTRCKFDAIHLKKRTNVDSIAYETRKKVLPEFIAERQRKIEIRKLRCE
ncbi:MAG: FAD-dependent oxidoreductase [Oscillospiraceae bacterium]|nr:FAD-dependent oxidoreductase [Oscillospiraceae bacterium]